MIAAFLKHSSNFCPCHPHFYILHFDFYILTLKSRFPGTNPLPMPVKAPFTKTSPAVLVLYHTLFCSVAAR
jgi:hypothetical protein